jgi:hypothetical protein
LPLLRYHPAMVTPIDLRAPFLVFANTLNITCWNNLRFTRSIISAGYVAAVEDPKFRDAYLNGTANYAPLVPNNARSSAFLSLFTVSVQSLYEVEYDAEYLRSREFPLLPSRFSAVYAFGSDEDCRKAHERYNWPLSELRRFRLVPHPFNRMHRANMEIVSLMRSVYPKASWDREQRDAIWRHYWSGGGSLAAEIPAIRDDTPDRQSIASGEIWEYLIEGRLELLD